jgi:magnesium and cobalt transporter
MNNNLNNSIALVDKDTKKSGNFIKRIFNIFKKETKEDLKNNLLQILDQYRANNLFNEVEKQIMVKTLSFSSLKAEDVMIHRTDIIAIEKNINVEELREVIIESKHTRFPIYEQNLDNIIGFIHIKDIIKGIFENEISLEKIMRPIPSVTFNLPLTELLVKMRIARVHMAVVIDEYGGVDGLVAFEDVIEEIIGEVYDEHDKESEIGYKVIIERQLIEASARLSLETLEELCELKFAKEVLEDIDTVGGLILSIEGRIPSKNEKLSYKNILEFEIVDADNRTIKWVKIRKLNDVKTGAI